MADPMTTVEIPPYSNNSGQLLIPTCIFGAIALVLVILRVYTRLTRTRRLYVDDWLVIVAESLSLPWFGLAGAAVYYGWGKPYLYLTPQQFDKTMKLQFALQTIWILSLCFVRLSVAATLLRFGTDKSWRIPLYIIMALQSLISSSYIVIQFAQCTPFSYPWDIQPGVKCWDVKHIINYGWVIAVVYTLMDLTLSLMPIKMIRTLTRPLSEKILIAFLMALGLLATGVAGAKMSTFNKFGQGDPMQESILPTLLAKLEEIVGIIAVSLPCLKSPTERLLKKVGLLKEHQLTRPSFIGTPEELPQMEQDRRSSGQGSGSSGSAENIKGVPMTNVEHVYRNDSGRAV